MVFILQNHLLASCTAFELLDTNLGLYVLCRLVQRERRSFYLVGTFILPVPMSEGVGTLVPV